MPNARLERHHQNGHFEACGETRLKIKPTKYHQ